MRGIAWLAVGLVWPCQGLVAQVERIATSATIMEVIEAVEEHHVRPPTRQEMVLAAVRRLYAGWQPWDPKGFEPNVNASLSRAVSKLTSKEEMRVFLDQSIADANVVVDFHDMAASVIDTTRIAQPSRVTRLGRISRVHQVAEDDVGVQIRENRYVGIGIKFGPRALVSSEARKGYMQAIHVFPRGPAYGAGMQPNDYIISIDGESMENMNTQDYIDRLRGQEGKEVTLDVRQPDEVDVRTLTFNRGVVADVVVEGWTEESPGEWDPLIADDMAYAKLLEIGSSTLHDLKQIAAKLKAMPDLVSGFDLVLDLRHVRSANLSHTVMMADALRSSGELGSVMTRMGRKVYEADEDCLFPNCLIYVLVDGSVSGPAEWLASSLREDNRIRVVGSPTAGYAYTQTAIPLSNGRSINLETAELLTGKMSLNRYGVTLDMQIRGKAIPTGVMSAFIAKEPAPLGHVR